jgi:hypothetical protein
MGDYNKAANGEQAGEPLELDQLEGNGPKSGFASAAVPLVILIHTVSLAR